MEQAHHAGQAPVRRLLLVRLLLLLLGGVLLVLLSSRPGGAAERQRSGSLDPAVGSTAPTRAAGALRRGTPATTSPVSQTVPPTSSVTRPLRRATAIPTNRLAGSLPSALTPVGGPVGPAAVALAPAAEAVAPATGQLAMALAPVGAAAGPVAGLLAPVTGPVGGTLDPVLGPLGRRVGDLLPDGLLPVELPLPGGPLTPRPSATTSRAGPVADLLTDPTSAGPAPIVVPPPDAADPPAAGRTARHHPGLPGLEVASRVPAPAELPAGRDAVSDSPETRVGLAALAGALLLFGLRRHARVRAETPGIRSRSYLPLVAPA